MSSTDNRIVKMQFDNAQFKREAAATQKSLADLNKSANSGTASKGMMDLGKSMEQVSVKAGGMQVAVAAAIGTIASKVTNTAMSLGKQVFFDPIASGFSEYEASLTKLNTIMNATGLSEQKVSGVLKELNDYSDKTIYSFGNMTESIMKFVNAGVPLDDAANSVKGVANAAAFAGASTEDANRAMFAFGQSISNGFLTLGDFNQLESANMATVQFKNTLLESAAAVGTLTKQGDQYITASGEAITATQGFQYSLKEQWATTDVLNGALAMYTDESTELGKAATSSAQEVRTFTAFIDTLKETVASGWARIFEEMIGGLGEATSFWTGLSNAVGGAVSGIMGWIIDLLHGFNEMGGRAAVIETIGHLLAPLGAILKVVGKAWAAAFPSGAAGGGLAAAAKGLELFTRPLELLADVIEGSVAPVTTFFKVIHIGSELLKQGGGAIAGFIANLAGLGSMSINTGGGSILGFVKEVGNAIADAIDKIDALVSKGASLGSIFGGVSMPSLPDIPALPSTPDLPSAPSIPSVSAPSVDTSGLDQADSKVKQLTQSVIGLGKAQEDAGEGSGTLKEQASKIVEASDQLQPATAKMEGFFSKLKNAIGSFLGGITFKDVLATFNLAALGVMIYKINGFLNSLKAVVDIPAAFSDMMGAIGDSLNGFAAAAQREATAKMLIALAIAIGIFALSLLVLSFVPMDKLGKALVALGAGLFMIQKTMGALEDLLGKMSDNGLQASVNAIALSIALVAFAGSIMMLAIAMRILDGVDWGSLIKAYVAMEMLSKAMEKLAEIDSNGIIKTSFALILVATALILFAVAIRVFAALPLGTFIEGSIYIGIALAGLIIALKGFEASLGGAAAILVVVVALTMLAGTIALYAALDLGTFAEGMTYVAIALLVLVVALYGFQSSLAGALAMMVVVVALTMLAGTIALFAALDWGTFLKGLAMLAIVLVVVTAGLALLLGVMSLFAPVAPALMLLSLAIVLVGVGLLALAVALAIIVPLAGAAVTAMVAMASGIAVAFTAFLQTLEAEAPIIREAFMGILDEVLKAVDEATPKVLDALVRFLENLNKKMPDIVKAGTKLIVSFLSGIAKSQNKINQKGAEILVNFINGLANNIGKIVEAGVNFIVKLIEGIVKAQIQIQRAAADAVIEFINGTADTLRTRGPELGEAMSNLGMAMIEGMVRGIIASQANVVQKAVDAAKAAVNAVKGFLGISSPSKVFAQIGKFMTQGMSKGIQDNASAAIVAVASMVQGQIAIANELVSGYIQKLDQQAIAARGKAEGMAAAADAAAKAADRMAKKAEKTKGKADDKKAKKAQKEAEDMRDKAEKAQERATKKTSAVEAAKARQDREAEFYEADYFHKAEMKAEDAQNELEAAKALEQRAVKNRQAAISLEKRLEEKNLSKAERKKIEAQIEQLRADAKADAKAANAMLAASRTSAAESLEWQRKAGEQAAAEFAAQFKSEAESDAEQARFEKLSNEEKATYREKQAADLEKAAQEQLAYAQNLAYTDLEQAREEAQIAMDMAEQARNYAKEAEQFRQQQAAGTGATVTSGSVVNLEATEAASIAMNRYSELYAASTAAAAATPTVQFTQYNTSPEALTPSEVYRQTNNLLNTAATRVAA